MGTRGQSFQQELDVTPPAALSPPPLPSSVKPTPNVLRLEGSSCSAPARDHPSQLSPAVELDECFRRVQRQRRRCLASLCEVTGPVEVSCNGKWPPRGWALSGFCNLPQPVGDDPFEYHMPETRVAIDHDEHRPLKFSQRRGSFLSSLYPEKLSEARHGLLRPPPHLGSSSSSAMAWSSLLPTHHRGFPRRRRDLPEILPRARLDSRGTTENEELFIAVVEVRRNDPRKTRRMSALTCSKHGQTEPRLSVKLRPVFFIVKTRMGPSRSGHVSISENDGRDSMAWPV